jgi:hypothetical protein
MKSGEGRPAFRRAPCGLRASTAAALLLAIAPAAFAQAPSTNNPSIELIDPNVFRVCAVLDGERLGL